MRAFVLLAVLVCATVAAPVESAEGVRVKGSGDDDAPLCGYVRMEETAWWAVGLQTHGVCEPIWDGQTAVMYRIDRDHCGCAFFATEEDCRGQGDVVLHRGPKFEESHFLVEEKPAWVLCQELEI